ncbi:hypothetical protein DU490_05295 [Halomonas sp. DQ26W]|uniref:hypothetical protein n=1 Tax=Halomonas sp. DQ26W TaxID=2282311 RepID=UPI000DF75527|nr:hypothetical protein [Halomonas sp. DQ26W]RDB43828.1 hypothetical protein DU490_05295 [Halomonas sp. DQ26W]
MRKAIFTALLALLLLPMTAEAEWRNYETEWDRSFNREVALALAANNVRGCGEFKHKRHIKGGSEYLVYCTADGERWRAYLVFAGVQRVTGPFEPHPMFD